MTLTIMSSAFHQGETIPEPHARPHGNQSPPLEWSGAPEGTQSYALIMDDPDAPGGTFRHWAMHDIPPHKTSLDAGEAAETGLPQAANDFGETGYGGPQPPAGHGPHRYQVRLMALDVPALDVPEGATVADVAEAAAGHVLEETELVGRYETP